MKYAFAAPITGTALAFLLLLTMPLYAQSSGRLRHVENRVVKQKQAPRAAITTLIAFIEYVRREKPDIATDAKASERWLTKVLRKTFIDAYEARVAYIRKHSDYKPEYPDNSSFSGVWEQPTTFSVVSGRQYDYHNADNPHAKRVVIDVLYEWGHEKIANYPGMRNLRTYIFGYEDNAWKLGDIYQYDDEFGGASSLLQSLERCVNTSGDDCPA
jgi:hypothetical protein